MYKIMKFISLIKSEFYKIRHTSFLNIHIFAALAGILIFLLYFSIYQNVDEYKKIKLLLEFTAIVFPLLISIVVGINITIEEKANYFQRILAVKNRNILLSKILLLFLTGLITIFMMFIIFYFIINITNLSQNISLYYLLFVVIGLTLTNFCIYLFHLFLNLKFGLGISLFWGVFESLQVILYSNVNLISIWRFNPFSWGASFINDFFNNNLVSNINEWFIIILISLGCYVILIKWFKQWEGRKNCE